MSKITTTIRWESGDLNDVKKAAKRVGLPVALYVKSIVLTRIRDAEEQPSIDLVKQILQAKQDLANGDFEVFENPQDLIEDLQAKIK